LSQHFSLTGDAAPPDHGPWDRILAQYVSLGADDIARFDYAAVTEADRAALEAYLGALTATAPTTLARDDQLAYWINLYNALTIRVVLDHYPVASIRRIKFGRLLVLGPWGEELIEVEGSMLSLDNIEHDIIRPIFADPRIHYGVNCASLGCPDLRTEAYEGARIDEQLDEAARAFVNHPRGARVANGRLHVSSIYHWFQEDFGGNDAGVIEHLLQHAEPNLAAALEGVDRIARHSYDWDLNEPDTE
jgi:hypothetical protein